jgi:hypothetical protein
MIERPILFNGEMVRAILEGRKTQTRRPLKGSPCFVNGKILSLDGDAASQLKGSPCFVNGKIGSACPLGQVGDRLWVRETFVELIAVSPATDEPMPRWASRITLEITNIRIENLQDISASDCAAEGIKYSPDVNPLHEFQEVWDSIYKNWHLNPFVWVVEFKVVD